MSVKFNQYHAQRGNVAMENPLKHPRKIGEFSGICPASHRTPEGPPVTAWQISESPSRDWPPLTIGSDLIELLRVHAGPAVIRLAMEF
jgi:hypothetical protein